MLPLIRLGLPHAHESGPSRSNAEIKPRHPPATQDAGPSDPALHAHGWVEASGFTELLLELGLYVRRNVGRRRMVEVLPDGEGGRENLNRVA